MNNTINISTQISVFSTIFPGKLLLSCILFSLSLFTILGNLLVLYAIRSEKRLRTVSNLFILSLAFADLAVGLIVMPLSAANIIAGQWPFSYFLCQMWLSIDYVASTASIFNLVLLSLDRYWAVVYPLRYLRKRTRKRATTFILIVWFISFLWAPAIIFWSHIIPHHSDIIKPNECDTAFRSNKIFKTLTALVNFYFPLLTMILISCRIMIAIRLHSKIEFGRRISSTTQKQMKQNRLMRINAALESGKNPIKRRKCSLGLSPNNNFQQEIPTPITVIVNPSDNIVENRNISSNKIDENHEQIQSITSSLNVKTRSRLSQIKPISMLIPSLSKITKNIKRRSEEIPRERLENASIKSSVSVFHNLKYFDRQSYAMSLNINSIPSALSTTSSVSDDYAQDGFIDLTEHKLTTSLENISM